jgi:hypothetical protein
MTSTLIEKAREAWHTERLERERDGLERQRQSAAWAAKRFAEYVQSNLGIELYPHEIHASHQPGRIKAWAAYDGVRLGFYTYQYHDHPELVLLRECVKCGEHMVAGSIHGSGRVNSPNLARLGELLAQDPPMHDDCPAGFGDPDHDE